MLSHVLGLLSKPQFGAAGKILARHVPLASARVWIFYTWAFWPDGEFQTMDGLL